MNYKDKADFVKAQLETIGASMPELKWNSMMPTEIMEKRQEFLDGFMAAYISFTRHHPHDVIIVHQIEAIKDDKSVIKETYEIRKKTRRTRIRKLV